MNRGCLLAKKPLNKYITVKHNKLTNMWKGSRVGSHDYTSRGVMCIVGAEEERSERNFGRVLVYVFFTHKMKTSMKLMSYIENVVR
jgi:hypothetical protein